MDFRLVVESFQSFAASAAPVAITSLWQCSLVACALAFCLRLASRVSASHRFILWTAGFVVLVVLPFLPQGSGAAHAGLSSSASAFLNAGSAKPWLQLDTRWSSVIAAIWILGSILRATDLVIQTFRLRKLWKSAAPAGFPTAGRRKAEVCTSKTLDRPSAIGFLAPRILVPDWLFNRLTPGELEQIILHEGEHLRRGDDWTNLFQKLCLVLFPLNPALWWIERQLCSTREMACDEGVIKITRAPRAYAACLTSVAECELQHRTAALSLGAWQRRSELVRRVHSILRRNPVLHPVASGVLVATLGGGLFALSVAFERCPQFVAFVPSQKSGLLASDNPQVAPANVVETAYGPVFQKSASKASFYAMEAKAVMPAPEQRSVPRIAGPIRIAAHARAHNAKVAEASAERATEQQWIVLMSWEQVENSGISDAQVSKDYPAQPSGSSKSLQSECKGTGRIRITRLVFKVLPTDSNSARPTAMPLHDGWFVIQL